MANLPCACDILGWGWVLKLCLDFYVQMHFSGLRVASVSEVVFLCWQSKTSLFLASALSHCLHGNNVGTTSESQRHRDMLSFISSPSSWSWNPLARPFSTGLNGTAIVKSSEQLELLKLKHVLRCFVSWGKAPWRAC